jgi:SAM-dependent methyltransferase
VLPPRPPDHWPLHALQWSRIGPPLRPVAEDLAPVARALSLLLPRARPLRALLLGVTPELATFAWPAGTALLAVDRSLPMIREVWPAEGRPALASAAQGDWRALPVRDGSVDLLAADGCLSIFDWSGYEAVLESLHRALAPGGLVALRLFTTPAQREDVGEVGRDLWAGRIGSFHAFKWRLAMALQPRGRGALPEVRLADVFDAFTALCPDRHALAARLGWREETIDTIDAYRGAVARYSFPPLSFLRPVLARRFVERACATPSYELGERCPTLLLAPR